ncbi:MAG: nucleotidyl transferase [Oscillochloris sp.]|nr:nucleotidyl transferase [Oscillochloris sp.]
MQELPLIGLIPAGGLAARLAPLPCSKELLPIGLMATPAGPRPKPVCLYLVERLKLAGVEKAFVVLRPGKWDIPAYLGDGSWLGLSLAYLIVHQPHGSPYTLDQARPFLGAALVAFGLPDVIVEPADAYARLAAHARRSGADLCLGLFPTDLPHTADMVDVDGAGRVRRIEIKPAQTNLRRTWMIAIWSPRFSDFLARRVAADAARRADPKLAPPGEFQLSHVFQAAIDAGMQVESLDFPAGSAIDVGLPDNLARAIHTYTAPPEA